MDNGLPESVGELLAWEEFYKHIAVECNLLRTGPRIELSPIAAVELKRTREILRKIEQKVTRLQKKAKAA